MNCQEVMELMQRYLDFDLSDQEEERLMAHLRQCPQCSEMFERLQQLSRELANLPKVVPPFSLVDAILPQLDEIDRQRAAGTVPQNDVSDQEQKRANRSAYRRRPFGPWAAFGGVVAAGIVLTLFITNPDINLLPSTGHRDMAGLSVSGQSGESSAIEKRKMAKNNGVANDSMRGDALANSRALAEHAEPKSLSQPLAGSASNIVDQSGPAADQREFSAPEGSRSSADPKFPTAEAQAASPQANEPSESVVKTAQPMDGSNDENGENKSSETVPPPEQREEAKFGLAAFQETEVFEHPEKTFVATVDNVQRKIVIRTAGDNAEDVVSYGPWSENGRADQFVWNGSRFEFVIVSEGKPPQKVVIDAALKTVEAGTESGT